MPDCIFCKIIEGKLPAQKVYENKDLVAFLDIHPINPGHTLIVPKEHCRNLLDMPERLIEKTFVVAKKIAEAVKKGTNAEGINVGVNNEPASGQVVFHAHIHIIPRYTNDGLKLWPGRPYQEGQALEMQKRILSELPKETSC